MKKLLIFSLIIVEAEANMSHSLSYQGYTGLINTPNAQVMNQGDLSFHYNNQFDNALRGYDKEKSYSYQEDYIFGAGLLPYFEIQGRLSESRGYHRDLSGNMKVMMPYHHKYLPNFALGVQDLGGGANNYGNYYAVLDKEFWSIRGSIGYGYAVAEQPNKKRMDGLFGGVEVKTFDWLYLLAEDDSRERFAGIRVELPKKWSHYFKLNTIISSNLSDAYKTSIAINLTIPLYENTKSYKHHTINQHRQEVYDLDTTPQNIQQQKKQKEILPFPKNTNSLWSPQKIKEQLKALGIQNIVIAEKDETLYVGYENNVYLFNDIDAMGVVIGLMSQSAYQKFIIEQKRSKVVVLTLEGNLKKAKEFYKTPSWRTKQAFNNTLSKRAPVALNGFQLLVSRTNDSFLTPSIEFSPKVITFVGNEFGLFTYKLWLRSKLHINLYKGLDLTAVGDIHVYDSEINNHNYDYFLKLYENGSHMESIMLNYSANILGAINTVSIGSFEENYVGAMDQFILNRGNHTIRLKAGYFEQFKDGDPHKERYLGKWPTRELYLAKYSYFFPFLDTLAEFQAGKYWNQDFGYNINAKRYFSDVAVYATFQESEANSRFSEQVDRYIGLGIEIPLTLKHTPMYRFGQIKGTHAFDYKVRTTVAREDGTNTIVPGGNYDPELAIEVEKYFINRNRLQLSYIKAHAFRLVESYEARE